MLWKKIITWHIPISILATVFVFSGIMHLVDPELYVSPVLQLLTGGLMLGAIFMATDYVTSPMSKKGLPGKNAAWLPFSVLHAKQRAF